LATGIGAQTHTRFKICFFLSTNRRESSDWTRELLQIKWAAFYEQIQLLLCTPWRRRRCFLFRWDEQSATRLDYCTPSTSVSDTHLKGGWVDPRCRPRCFDFPLSGIEQQLLGRSACSLVTDWPTLAAVGKRSLWVISR
jgi:hypothetical protein